MTAGWILMYHHRNSEGIDNSELLWTSLKKSVVKFTDTVPLQNGMLC